MELKFVDPRSLKDNPDKARRSKSSPQADALLLATIKAVGIVQPPVAAAETDGGNSFVNDDGRRRVKQAIAAGLEEVAVLVVPTAEDGGAMRSLATAITHEQLQPVNLWRAIKRLVALGWTEEAIGIALAESVRQIKKLRLLANVLPARLDHMAKGDMPNEQQLRTIAAASLDEQKESGRRTSRPRATRRFRGGASLTASPRSACMPAMPASATTSLRPIASPGSTTCSRRPTRTALHHRRRSLPPRPAGVDDVEPAQEGGHHRRQHLRRSQAPGQGRACTPKRSDHTAMYLDREGKVKTVHIRMPEAKKAKGRGACDAGGEDEAIVVSKPRPDVTRKGIEMIGDLRTDALHEALSGSEQEQCEIDGLEGSRSAGARLASCVEGSRVRGIWFGRAAHLKCSRVSGLSCSHS